MYIQSDFDSKMKTIFKLNYSLQFAQQLNKDNILFRKLALLNTIFRELLK